MKKTILILTMAAACSTLAAAPFSLSADGLSGGRLSRQEVLSEAYGFGCSGQNRSPALSWKNAPAGTKSFAVTMYDRDAPTGLGWMHWVVVNIPAGVNGLPAGIRADGQGLPEGAVQSRTDFGVPGYGGACPPPGRRHRYVITLTALNVDKLPHVGADATPAMVGFFTRAHKLGEAKLTLTYRR